MKKRMDESGQGLLEYALIMVLAVAALILILQLFGISLRDVYCAVADMFTNSGTCLVSPKPAAVCEDDFSQGLTDWQTLAGMPQVKSGNFCVNGSTQTFNQCSMKNDLQDYVIHLEDVILNQGSGFGVFFRTTFRQQGPSGYIFQYDPGMKYYGSPNGTFLIRRWMNGKEIWKPIAETEIPADFAVYNTPHDIDIVVSGAHFTVLIDGEQVLEATDHVYKEGGVGLRSWSNSTACTSHFSIHSVTP